MPSRSEKSSFQQSAVAALKLAADATSADKAADRRQEASVLALLAIAEGLDGLRQQLVDVEKALTDQDGYGAGDHLHYISDWLEKIAGRPS